MKSLGLVCAAHLPGTSPAVPTRFRSAAHLTVLLAAFVALFGCAPAGIGSTAPLVNHPTVGPLRDSRDAAAVTQPPIVQVRDRSASTAQVFGWTADEPFYGLHARVGQNGRLEGNRLGDHRLYLSTTYVGDMGGFVHAVAPQGTLLPRGGVWTDVHACQAGYPCSPRTTIGVSVPDALLREKGDSLVVTFHPSVGRNWTITLRRDLIDAYLAAVDSVISVRREK